MMRAGLSSRAVFFEVVVVDSLVFSAHAVVGDVVESAGEVGFVAVGEVTAVGEIHREDFIAGLEHGEIDGGVGLGAGVGLHIGVLCSEDFLGALDGEFFHDIDVFTTSIPTSAGVSFGVFIGEQ